MAQAKESSSQQSTEPATLEARIENLEALVSKLSVMVGQGNMLSEFNIERWSPSKKDMSKFKG